MRQKSGIFLLAILALALAPRAEGAALLRLDVAARTEAGSFHAPLLHEHLAFGEPRVDAHRLTIPLGGAAAAEARLVTRLLVERGGDGAADVRLQAFAEVVNLSGGAPENLRGCRAARRERFALLPGTSRVVEMALAPSGGTPEGARAPLRFHLLLTHEAADEARAFVETLAAAGVPGGVEEMWRFRLTAKRVRGGEESVEEALELWSRSGGSVAYRHERGRADGGVLEFFDLLLSPVEEEGAVVLVTEAKGSLQKADGSALGVDRRDVHEAGGGAALALRYGEANEAGLLREGMAFSLVMERVLPPTLAP